MGILKTIRFTRNILLVTWMLVDCSVVYGQSLKSPLTITGGNNQIGDNNTQNIYSDARLTQDMAFNIDRFISKIERDSNFYHIRNFKVNLAMTSNGAALKADIIKYFKAKGLEYIGNEREIIVRSEILEGLEIGLRKTDSCLTILIGIL